MTLDEPIRYPERTSILFQTNGNSEEIVFIQKKMQEFGSYADGYQTGALKLIDSALNSPSYKDTDQLIYPIVFLIRHYIELRLKELIQALNYCNEQTMAFPTGHNLSWLWKDFKTKYTTIQADIDNEEFKGMESLINELHSIDPGSMSFRYHVDLAGNDSQSLETINLVNLRETFIRICYMFDGLSMHLAHLIDTTNEMLSYNYSEYYE